MVVIGDHAAVVQVLRDRPEGFRRTSRLEGLAAEMGGEPGLFSANGEVWKRQRRMVMAGFDPAHVRRYHPSLQQVARRLAARWTGAARRGAAIDLQADLMRYTVDAVAGLAFGAEVNTLQSDGDVIQQHLDKVFPALFTRLFAPFPTWRYVRLPADRALERSVAAVRVAVGDFIAQARAAWRPTRPGASTRPTCWRPWSWRPTKTAAASTTGRSPATCSLCCWPARTPRPTRWPGWSTCCGATRPRWPRHGRSAPPRARWRGAHGGTAGAARLRGGLRARDHAAQARGALYRPAGRARHRARRCADPGPHRGAGRDAARQRERGAAAARDRVRARALAGRRRPRRTGQRGTVFASSARDKI